MADLTGVLGKSSWAGSGDALKRKYGTMVIAKFMNPLIQRVGMLPYTWSQDWDMNTGDTMLLKRLNVDSTIMPAIDRGQEPTATDRSVQTIEAALLRFAKAHNIDKETKMTGIGPLLEQLRTQVGFETARDIDDYLYRTMSPLETGSFGRIDSRAGNHQFFTTTGDGATDGTTVVSTELGQADDYWNNGTVVALDGNNAGLAAKKIDDFANATGTITMVAADAFEYRVLNGTRLLVGRNVGHIANDADEILAAGHFDEVMVQFSDLGMMPYDSGSLQEFLNVPPGENPITGHYVVGLTSQQYSDFWKDPLFKEIASAGDAWKPAWSNYAMKRWMGFAIHQFPRQFRTTAPATSGTDEATTRQAGGAVHVATFLSQFSMSASKLTGYGRGKAGISIYYKEPNSGTVSQPTNAKSVLAAEIYWARAVTMGCGGFNVATTARKG